MNELQVVVFELSGQLFGAEASQVFQIIRYQELKKIKKMPSFIDGVISYMDDQTLPIINLAKRFHMGSTDVTKKTKILVTKLGEKLAGFIVDDVTEIVYFEDKDVEPAPPTTSDESKAYITKIGKREDNLISIIDFSKVLSDNEISQLVIKQPKN